MNKDQLIRMSKINELIEFISKEELKINPKASSYPFYYDKLNRYSKFIESPTNSKIFYLDSYTGKSLYPYSNSKWRGFSSGGTMRGLVEVMRKWIITGKPSDYGCLYVPYWGSYWGLESRQSIIDFAKDIGYIKKNSESYLDYLLSLPEYQLAYACDITKYKNNKRKDLIN